MTHPDIQMIEEQQQDSHRDVSSLSLPQVTTYVRSRNKIGLLHSIINSKYCRHYILLIVIICQIFLIAYLFYYIINQQKASPTLKYHITTNNSSQIQQLNTSDAFKTNKSSQPKNKNTQTTIQGSIQTSNNKQSNQNEAPFGKQSNNIQSQVQMPEPNSKEAGPLQSWPSHMSDYNISGNFNLWDMTPSYKALLLEKYSKLAVSLRPVMTEGYTDINFGKNVGFQPYQKRFEAGMEVVDWNSIQLSPQEQDKLLTEYQTMLSSRRQNLASILKKYQAKYFGKSGFLDEYKKITYEIFLQNLEYQSFTGQDINNREDLTRLQEREKKYYQTVHKVHKYPKQIHACVVAPTYKNNKAYRYAWHIQSLAQQQYSNYKVIIIDDFSDDGTAERIAKHLKWRGLPKDKFILIRNKVHRTALENIYYATHKYCDYNQIAYVIDGDDELVGTQVFRLYNAIYQERKPYVLYSNYLSYNPMSYNQPLNVGISSYYPDHIIRQSKYRKYSHAYGHLRTMITDLFLFQRAESLQDDKGQFYWILYDNAIYYPALEMSCGRVEYITDLKYWYTSNTGMNDYMTPKKKEYKEVINHVANIQKRYHCIENIFQVISTTLRQHQN